MVSPSKIDQVVQELRGYEPEEIILFGSAARGDAGEHSDIDLIVVKKTDRQFVQRLSDVKAFLYTFSGPEEVVKPIRLRREDYKKPLTIQSCCGTHPSLDS